MTQCLIDDFITYGTVHIIAAGHTNNAFFGVCVHHI